jgi:hypothetical protein
MVSETEHHLTLLCVEFAVKDGFDHGATVRIEARDEACNR